MHNSNLSDEIFGTIVQHTPLVSIDLIIRDREGCVLVAYRMNEPAKGSYFVPGGRIRKGETIEAAFTRVLATETGLTMGFADASLIGVYQHIYSTNRFGHSGYGTHYVVLAYQISLKEKPAITLDEQHSRSKWLTIHELKTAPDVHPYVKAYFGGNAIEETGVSSLGSNSRDV